jgi:hypothetical protein
LEAIHNAFIGVPESDLRKMIGENAARIYNFDMQSLRSIVQRIGPRREDIVSGESRATAQFTERDYADSRVFSDATFAPQLRRSLQH